MSKTIVGKYIIPGKFKFQSVDVGDFANNIIHLIDQEPKGKTDDFGGPEIVTLKEMATMKIETCKEKNKVLSISLPGKLSKSYVEGKNTNHLQKNGKITFLEYLEKKKRSGSI